MAKKNLTTAQIIMLLNSSDGDIASTGLSKKQILKAFISSPDLVQKFQENATKAVTPYQQFDPSFVYNEGQNSNATEDKYMAMGPKYQAFVQDYFKKISDDSSMDNVTKVAEAFRSNIGAAQKKYGLSEQELNNLIIPLTSEKELNSFRANKAAREKSQYVAFNQKKLDLGIKDPASATESYLEKVTGIKGLGKVTSNDQYVTDKTQDFLKIIKEKGVTDPYKTAEYEKMFKTALSQKLKKSKKTNAGFSKLDLLKKNIGNL